MNIVANTTTWPGFNGSATSPSAAQATTGTDTTPAVPTPDATPMQGHHHHHERHEEGEEHHGHHDQQAYVALQIKVDQTFSALTAPASGGASADGAAATDDGDGDDDGARLSALVKANFSLSEGAMSASLSIRMGAEGQSGNDLATQMQGFVQTLYAALHSLFGGSPAAPSATLGTPVTTGTAAALTGAPTAAATSPPAATTPAATATAAAPAAAADTATSEASTPPAASTTPASSGSLAIKLRLTYSSFGSQLGNLTQQLAQPGAAQTTPGLSGLMDDLASRFGQMLSASPNGSRNVSLGEFLSALAKAFAPQASGAGAPSSTLADTAGTGAAATESAATGSVEAPAAAASAYGQVLSFSASVRSQWLLAA